MRRIIARRINLSSVIRRKILNIALYSDVCSWGNIFMDLL